MTTATAKKITRTTFKSFVNKDRESLLILVKSAFCGMTDCCEETGNKEFTPALLTVSRPKSTLCIRGVVLVSGSGNLFRHYETETHIGIEVYNCVRHFIVAYAK